MTEKIQRLIRGYVRIRVRTVFYDRFLNICALHGFYIWDLTPKENAYELNISIEDFESSGPWPERREPISALLKSAAFHSGFSGTGTGKRLQWVFSAGRPFCSCFLFYLEYRDQRQPFRLRRGHFTVISKEEKATYGTLKIPSTVRSFSPTSEKNFQIFSGFPPKSREPASSSL